MIVTEQVTHLLNGTIETMKSIFPLTIQLGKPMLVEEPLYQQEMGVLIGITGDIPGRIMIQSQQDVFSQLGQAMFGLPVEGEMLESFAGEVGNMIAGNLSTVISQIGMTMDITPPTVIVGDSKVYGFKRAFQLPVTMDTVGTFTVVLIMDEQ
ncbi:chemotaxis protein CheX [Aeribacillus pallidus]|uniref:chemotaxis protein CheX n=1 Tax=Aeribacillus pallidus TaxID=33936 RepID=UPI001D74C0EC|nr:chemotaxis protein CheX [Bacillus sp. (in: firmicutes)]